MYAANPEKDDPSPPEGAALIRKSLVSLLAGTEIGRTVEVTGGQYGNTVALRSLPGVNLVAGMWAPGPHTRVLIIRDTIYPGE